MAPRAKSNGACTYDRYIAFSLACELVRYFRGLGREFGGGALDCDWDFDSRV